MTPLIQRWCGAFLAAWLLTTGLALGDGASISATLEPRQVGVGEQAQLTVSVSGANTAPTVPDVPGLEISHVGQSTQIQIINGSMSASATHTYIIVPQREGTYNIPPIQVGDAKSQPLTLKVVKGSGNPSAGGSSLPPPNVGSPAINSATPADAAYGFIKIGVPKKEVYVGELIPVEVKAYLNGRARITNVSLPSFTSDAFTMNPLGNRPSQRDEMVNGVPYRVLTWRSAMTAVKTGDFTPQLEMPISVIIAAQRTRSGNPLEDFFNDSTFFNRGQPKDVTLKNEPETLKVLPLPKENRPADFTGAIGNFQIGTTATPQSVGVGDPVTLRLNVTGTGNFDRVTSTLVPNSLGWKTYPPKNSFEPSDNVGYEGTKSFEQVVMPNNPGRQNLPPISFAFFDPEKKAYVTRASAPLSIEVTGAAVAAPTVAPTPSVTTPAPQANKAPAKPADDLVANKLEPGAFVATLKPVYLSPWFLSLQSLPLILLIVGIAYLRYRQKLANDPRYARAAAAQQAIAVQLTAMDGAMQNHEAAAFFTAALRAIQQRLGARWGVNPESITLDEVRSRMNGEADTLRPLFEMADQVSYSGQALGDADFRHWKEFVTTQLKRLENPA